jgi:endogenous inhibitor of DNA gyrase (YacG/DUF329 family)
MEAPDKRPKMSIPEFNRAAKVWQKRSATAILVPGAILIVCGMACAPFHQRFESFLATKFDSFAADILAVLPLGLAVIIMLLCIVWLTGRVERQFGIPCPHCAKALAAHNAIVIASRNCPYCGKRVIDDDDAKSVRAAA